MPNSEVNSYFVPYAEQEGPHKVHYVFVPIEFPELPLDKEFKRQVTMPNLQRVTIDHQFGWGNEEDSERIRFIVPNTPALQAEDGNYYLEDHIAWPIKTRAQIIREYTDH